MKHRPPDSSCCAGNPAAASRRGLTMTQWQEMLDSVVARSGSPPPAVQTLKLPGIEGWGPGYVWGSWKVDSDFFHGGGALFGGYLAALADSIVGLACLSVLTDNEMFTTADLRISFFRPVSGGTLSYGGEVLNRGRRMAHCEVTFTNDEDKVVAKATATQAIIPFGEAAGGQGPGRPEVAG